jgi:hypothetical protein
MGRFKRFIGAEKHDYHSIEWPYDVETTVDDVDGVLMKVTPYPENNGIVAAAGLLQSIHDEYTRGVHSFEIWFVDGKFQFFVQAADDDAADSFRRRISSNYRDASIVELEDGRGFPHIEEGEHLAGATIKKNHPEYNFDYLPIRHFKDGEGWDMDPYKEVLSAMLSDDHSRVVVQVLMRAVPESWTESNGFGDMSVDDVAEELEKGQVKGWINPRVTDPNPKDVDAAKLVQEMRHKPAYGTNINVLTISANPREASNRAAGVGRTFKKYYNSVSEMGLKPKPVDGRTPAIQKRRLKKHLKRMRKRKITDDGCVLSIEELAGVAHLPEGDIPTPQIEWKYSRSGEDVPSDAPQHAQHDRPTEFHQYDEGI